MQVPKIRATLSVCGDCGKPKKLGQRHTCVTPLDRKPRNGKTRLDPRFSYSLGKCGTCHKEIRSLPHVCNVRSDFRKRKAEQEKREAAERRKAKQKGKRRDNHPDAADCADESCRRYACVQAKIAFRRGHAAGYASGFAQGHAEGHQEGHQAGYAEGYAAGSAGSG